MMQASAYGRLASDPREITTKSGKPMAVARIAVQMGDDDTLWLNVIAFGSMAEMLLKHGKGEFISISGRVQKKSWTDKEGQARESLEIVADTIVSARTVRPGGGKKRDTGDQRREPKQPSGGGRPFDDQIPFGPEVRG